MFRAVEARELMFFQPRAPLKRAEQFSSGVDVRSSRTARRWNFFPTLRLQSESEFHFTGDEDEASESKVRHAASLAGQPKGPSSGQWLGKSSVFTHFGDSLRDETS